MTKINIYQQEVAHMKLGLVFMFITIRGYKNELRNRESNVLDFVKWSFIII